MLTGGTVAKPQTVPSLRGLAGLEGRKHPYKTMLTHRNRLQPD
jgi:hypothetical protein